MRGRGPRGLVRPKPLSPLLDGDVTGPTGSTVVSKIGGSLVGTLEVRNALGAAGDVKVKNSWASLLGLLGNASHQSTDSGAGQLATLTQIDAGADLATAGTRFTLLRGLAIAHFPAVGDAVTDGPHKASDGISGGGIGTDVSTLGNLITRIGELKDALVAHAQRGGVHFGPDPDLEALALTHEPPTTQSHCNADINDLAAAMQAHFDRSAEVVYA